MNFTNAVTTVSEKLDCILRHLLNGLSYLNSCHQNKIVEIDAKIGEEFAPRKHNVIVESLGSTTVTSNISTTSSSSGLTQTFGPNVVFVNANGTSSMPIQVQQLLQQAQQQVILQPRSYSWYLLDIFRPL